MTRAACPHCRAPEPIAGVMEHAWDCPAVTRLPPRVPAPREQLVAFAREAEAGWDRLKAARRTQRPPQMSAEEAYEIFAARGRTGEQAVRAGAGG